MKQAQVLTRKKVADILGINGQTVDEYRKKGILFAFRYTENGRWRYKLEDVLQLRDKK